MKTSDFFGKILINKDKFKSYKEVIDFITNLNSKHDCNLSEEEIIDFGLAFYDKYCKKPDDINNVDFGKLMSSIDDPALIGEKELYDECNKLLDIWEYLETDIGYSKGDVIKFDDFIKAGGNVKSKFDFEMTFDVRIFKSEEIIGTGPGDYEYIRDFNRKINELTISPDIVKNQILKYVNQGKIHVIGKYKNKLIYDLDEIQDCIEFFDISDQDKWDYMLDLIFNIEDFLVMQKDTLYETALTDENYEII